MTGWQTTSLVVIASLFILAFHANVSFAIDKKDRRKSIAESILVEVGISLSDAFSAVSGMNNDALVRLVSYSSKRGLRPLRESIRTRVESIGPRCQSDPRMRDQCESESRVANAELARIRDLEFESNSKDKQYLGVRRLLAAIVYRDQVSTEIIDVEYKRMSHACKKKGFSDGKCSVWRENIVLADELSELVFRMALARYGSNGVERPTAAIAARFREQHAIFEGTSHEKNKNDAAGK